MPFAVIFVVAVLLSTGSVSAGGDIYPKSVATISGRATVADGDGIKFGEVEIRLQGIAAPEYGYRSEPMGKESKENLIELVSGKFITCFLDGTTAGGRARPAGVCYLDNEDIGFIQVREGFARDCPYFSKGRYRAIETAARKTGKNLSKVYALPDYCTEKTAGNGGS